MRGLDLGQLRAQRRVLVVPHARLPPQPFLGSLQLLAARALHLHLLQRRLRRLPFPERLAPRRRRVRLRVTRRRLRRGSRLLLLRRPQLCRAQFLLELRRGRPLPRRLRLQALHDGGEERHAALVLTDAGLHLRLLAAALPQRLPQSARHLAGVRGRLHQAVHGARAVLGDGGRGEGFLMAGGRRRHERSGRREACEIAVTVTAATTAADAAVRDVHMTCVEVQRVRRHRAPAGSAGARARPVGE